MIPNEVFKRRPRHNNTPQSILLIITNFIVVTVDVTLFTDKTHVNWFFWIVLALLASYNFYTVRRFREEFTKVVTIVYIVNILILIGVFFLFRGKSY